MSGKPKKIDESLLKWMATRQCTQVEMAEALGCSVDTLSRRFAEDMTKWRSVGKTRLRAMQWKRARKGSDSMLIHLGNQYLGQSNKHQIETVGEPFDPLAAYEKDPALIERAIQLRRDAYDARGSVDTVATGGNDLPGVDVSGARGGNGTVHDAATDRPDDESGGSSTAS